MKAKHTTGATSVYFDEDAADVGVVHLQIVDHDDKSTEAIAMFIGDDMLANAKRASSCWNACDGINPEAVPALLEAVESLVKQFGQFGPNLDIRKDFSKINALESARRAIDLAKGGG